MGLYLNPGNGLFQISLDSLVYVDKSGLIGLLNERMATEQRFVCMSRPRRFGKSMAANMLVAYYDRTCDSHAQFDGLAVASCLTYASHLNSYDVIHLNMQDFVRRGEAAADAMFARLNRAVTKELLQRHPDIDFFDSGAPELVFSQVYATTRVPFVFVIDEWDCVFRLFDLNNEVRLRYLDWLRLLLKDREYVGLAYLTGILPIKKYGEHSALNMFDEVSMTGAGAYAPFTGFTSHEVEALCTRFDVDYEQMRSWYDGYTLDDCELYCPRSVVAALDTGEFHGYWNRTETFEALRRYISMDLDGLRGDVVKLLCGESLPVNTLKFQNDMVSVASADDVLTLLVHLGYLTYDTATRQVRIPNNEVREVFEASVEDCGWSEVSNALALSDRLLQATLSLDAKEVAAIVQRVHEDSVSILRYNDENSLSCVLGLAYYTARRSYSMHRELPSGKGFADLVLLPRKHVRGPAIVIELKWGSSPQEAIAQIRERNYCAALSGHADQCLLVGISYDKVSKVHACAIERVCLR